MNHEPQPADDTWYQTGVNAFTEKYAPTTFIERLVADGKPAPTDAELPAFQAGYNAALSAFLHKHSAREQYERAYRFNREGDYYHTDIGDVPCDIAVAAHQSFNAKDPNDKPFYLRHAERSFRDAQRGIGQLAPYCLDRSFGEAITRLVEARANWHSMCLRWIAEPQR